jgi:hypothetical protein
VIRFRIFDPGGPSACQLCGRRRDDIADLRVQQGIQPD